MKTVRIALMLLLVIPATAQATVFVSVNAVDGTAEIQLVIHNGSYSLREIPDT